MDVRRIGFALLAVVAAAASGGSAAAKEAPDVLRWRHTYAEALREARLRNVPVWITRHKDG